MVVTKEFIYDRENELELETIWSPESLELTILHPSGADICKLALTEDDVKWLVKDLNGWLCSRKKSEVEHGE